MIYSRLHGRLGNQMFQYAAGAALAHRLGVSLALDWRRAEVRGEGRLTDVFDLPVARPDRMPPGQDAQPLRYAAWRLLGRKPKFRREKGLGYNPAFETWGNETYLHGYWQSERYFLPISDHLRRVFTMVPPMSPANAEMSERIAASTSVALHVRRGDYVAIGAAAACDQEYYDAALKVVTEGLGQRPTVFVFSDDPDWARNNLNVPFDKVIVDLNGPDTAHEDMRLMSLCQHNIIANSTFSWWSAWLNTSPGKRVVGPARWVLNADQHNPDILPKDWIAV